MGVTSMPHTDAGHATQTEDVVGEYVYNNVIHTKAIIIVQFRQSRTLFRTELYRCQK